MIRRRARAAAWVDRTYSVADFVLFEKYRDARGEHAPAECNDGPRCWVREGPPAISGNNGGSNHCLGCGGSPRQPIVVARRATNAKC